jgi:hypothetical protein
MTSSTQLHGLGTYTHSVTAEGWVRESLNEYEDDYDVSGLAKAFRVAVNEQLDGTTIVLIGNDFYCDDPAPDDSRELIEAAIESVDLDRLAAEYDRS